jgi:hypothetical protein
MAPGTKVTVKFDDGTVVTAYVVEDLGGIGVGGRRLLRVSSEKDPTSEAAVVFDLPLDPARTKTEDPAAA